MSDATAQSRTSATAKRLADIAAKAITAAEVAAAKGDFLGAGEALSVFQQAGQAREHVLWVAKQRRDG